MACMGFGNDILPLQEWPPQTSQECQTVDGEVETWPQYWASLAGVALAVPDFHQVDQEFLEEH